MKVAHRNDKYMSFWEICSAKDRANEFSTDRISLLDMAHNGVTEFNDKKKIKGWVIALNPRLHEHIE